MRIGDTFISPTGPAARFPEREMRVISVHVLEDGTGWVDAAPVRPLQSDEFTHCTYRLDALGNPLPVYPDDDDAE
jgi:hypothetical protein